MEGVLRKELLPPEEWEVSFVDPANLLVAVRTTLNIWDDGIATWDRPVVFRLDDLPERHLATGVELKGSRVPPDQGQLPSVI